MATEALNSNMVGHPTIVSHVTTLTSATPVIMDAQGRPVTQTEIVQMQNPGYMTRIRQAATKHPWMSRALIGAGMISPMIPNVAAANSTFDFSFIGDMGHSLISSITPLGADVQAFLQAWVGPICELIVVVCVVGVAFAFRDKIEGWAKKF